MNEYNYATVSLNSWKEYKAFVNDLSENWAYHGQANCAWVLNNAIERTDFIHFHKGIEAEFVAEFQRGASNYLNRDEMPKHLIEWLALMQHHGAPTRLLDFSKSSFIAVFFVYEICLPNDDYKISIWAINVKFLKTKAVEVLSEKFAENITSDKKFIDEQLFENFFTTIIKAWSFRLSLFA